MIGNSTEVTVVRVCGEGVQLGITADREIRVDRKEIRCRPDYALRTPDPCAPSPQTAALLEQIPLLKATLNGERDHQIMESDGDELGNYVRYPYCIGAAKALCDKLTKMVCGLEKTP